MKDLFVLVVTPLKRILGLQIQMPACCWNLKFSISSVLNEPSAFQ